MKLRHYIREMVEAEINEMAAIATLEKIKNPEKLAKFKKLYGGNENSLVSKIIDTIEKGSVKIGDIEKAASDPKAQEVIKFIEDFNSKPGFQNHPTPIVILDKEFGSVNDLISKNILTKVDGATRNGIVVATNKSHTAGISPTLRDLSKAGILANPKEEGEYIVPKKEKSEPGGIKGRPASEKTLVAKEVNDKLETDSNYKPTEEEVNVLGSDFIEKMRMRVMGTLKRGRTSALKNAMKGLEDFEDDEETLNENELNKTGIPLTSEVKAYIDKSLAELKASEDFEYLKDVGFFETEFEENTLLEFEDQYPDADNVSKEVHDYIQAKVYRNSNLNENKKIKKQPMKKQLNEEFKRMRKLAGLITENENSEIKMDGNFTYLEMSANNLYEYLKNNFPELASLEKCMTLIEFVEENVAQDREDEDEEMELITMPVPEFWDAYDNFYGKF